MAFTQTGTPYYASPQIWRDEPYSCKADMWSFGCLIYEMAAFRPPFEASDIEQLYKKIKKGKYDAVPAQYSAELSEVIAICLNKKVERRLSAEELLSLPSLIRKCAQFGIYLRLPQSDSVKLLNTIKISNDPAISNPCLPTSCYNSEKMKKLTEQTMGRSE